MSLSLKKLVDKPGTTIGTKFSVLHFIRLPSLMSCGFLTTGPLVRIPVILAEFSECVSSRSFTATNKSNYLTYTVASSFCLQFAVGCDNRRRTLRDPYGFQFGRVQVFPAQHVHGRSTTNSLTLVFIKDGAGRHHSLVSEKKVALSFSLSFKIFLASLHASPREHRSCLAVSS